MSTSEVPVDSETTSDASGEPQAAAASPVPRVTAPRRRTRPSFIAGAPTVGFTGPNGAGKTLVAVSCIINDDMANGRPVYSTVPIHSPYGDSIPITSLRQLLTLHDATVFLDEIAVIFSSRDSLAVPREFDKFLQTLRHQRLTLRWTAPAWARADLRVREITQVVVSVNPLGKYVRKGDFWPTPLAVMAGALDCTSVGVDDKPEKVLRRRVFLPKRLGGWGAYDTHADTPRIGAAPHSGACVDCGGTVAKPRCSPERHRDLGITMPSYAPPEERRRTTTRR